VVNPSVSQPLKQFGKRDRQPVRKCLEHRQTGILFSGFNFRKLIPVDRKEVRYFQQHHPFSILSPRTRFSSFDLRLWCTHPSWLAIYNILYAIADMPQIFADETERFPDSRRVSWRKLSSCSCASTSKVPTQAVISRDPRIQYVQAGRREPTYRVFPARCCYQF
jgi:hypothetical protein